MPHIRPIPKELRITGLKPIKECQFKHLGEAMDFVLKSCANMKYDFSIRNEKNEIPLKHLPLFKKTVYGDSTIGLEFVNEDNFDLQMVYYLYNVMQEFFGIELSKIGLYNCDNIELPEDFLKNMTTIKSLSFVGNELISIPELPPNLEHLYIDEEKNLFKIPKLPNKLTTLFIGESDIDLPSIPNSVNHIKIEPVNFEYYSKIRNHSQYHSDKPKLPWKTKISDEYLNKAKIEWMAELLTLDL